MSLPTPYYQSERVTLYCGDARTIAPAVAMESVVGVVTDPPYGINHSSAHGASWQNTRIAGDADTSVRDSVLEPFGTVAAFGTWKTPPIVGVRGALVWDKGPAFGMGDLSFPWKPSWEMIYLRGDDWRGVRDEGVLRGPVVVSWESKGREHPHEKPVWLLGHLIDKLPEQLTIFDPFCGVGTCAQAAIRLGRPWIGSELSEEYCAIAKRRIQEAEQAFALFEPQPQAKQAEMFERTPTP